MRVSFIGLGNMGEPMAANLAKAGYNLVVYDVDRARAAEVAKAIGATAATTLADVAEADICITMLPTSDIVQEVLVRSEGGAFLNAAASGTIVVDMSSSDPATTRETGRLLAEKGVLMVDAPVSGAVPRAVDGSLAIMIGSDDEAAVDKVTPVLETLGKKLFRVGPLGAGDVMKAANNFVAAATYTALAEALSMGKTFGLDPVMMTDILNVSTGRSFISELLITNHVLTGKYASGFALGLLAKDVGIAAKIGADLGMDVPMTRLTNERWQLAKQVVGGDKDNSEALRGWYGPLWETAA